MRLILKIFFINCIFLNFLIHAENKDVFFVPHNINESRRFALNAIPPAVSINQTRFFGLEAVAKIRLAGGAATDYIPSVKIISASDPAGITLQLQKEDTAYLGNIGFSKSISSAKNIKISDGDLITAVFIYNNIEYYSYANWYEYDSYVSKVIAYPNPVNISKNTQMTFRAQYSSLSVKIYSFSGELVFEDKSNDNNIIIWNFKNNSGQLLAPGLYLYVAENNNNVFKGKIAVIDK